MLRKTNVDKDILVTSRNGDRKIMQSIRIMSRPAIRIRKRNQLSQLRLKFTNVIPTKKDLNWLHFDNEARLQEKQQMKDQ